MYFSRFDQMFAHGEGGYLNSGHPLIMQAPEFICVTINCVDILRVNDSQTELSDKKMFGQKFEFINSDYVRATCASSKFVKICFSSIIYFSFMIPKSKSNVDLKF